MKNIERRIEKIEDKLRMGQESRVICLKSANPDEAERALPENLEEWLTYQKHKGSNLILVSAWDEIKTRQGLQKTTKTNENLKNE